MMRRATAWPGVVPALVLVFLVAGCAAPQTQKIIADADGVAPRAEVASVPFFAQQKYYCGPAALAMALSWSGLPVTRDDLVGQVYTPGREGSLRSDIVAAARRNGRLAVPVGRLSDLLGELAAGHPVVVFQNLGLGWAPQWHFAVAVGYDLAARSIHLRSGMEQRRITALDTFERTWARGGSWALVVLPPGRLPATARETPVVRAAAALERVGRHAEAAAAYDAASRRWPASLGAVLGLGNARHALGDLAGAEAAFLRATRRHPRAAGAWNNLAHVLGRLGRRADAMSAARTAVALGGRDRATYRKTLRQVSRIPG